MTVSGKWKLDRIFLLLEDFRLSSLIITPTKQGYKPVNSGNRILYFFYVIGLNLLLNIGFQYFRFFQISIHQNVEELVLDWLWVTGYSLSLYFYLHLLFLRQPISEFLNMLRTFHIGLNGNWMPKKMTNRFKIWRKENIPQMLMLSAYPLTLSLSFINVLSRYSSRYYFSVLSEPHTFGVMDVTLHFVFDFATMIFPTGALFYYCIILCIYVYCTSHWLKNISTHETGLYIRRVYLREKYFQIYRGLQIMNSEFNYQFGKAIIQPLLFLIFYSSILCILILINFHTKLHFFYLIVFPFAPIVSICGILVMFPMAAKLSSTSASFVRMRDGEKLSAYNKAFLRSCRPLKICVGPYLVITRTTTIAGLGLIAYFTLRLIAAL